MSALGVFGGMVRWRLMARRRAEGKGEQESRAANCLSAKGGAQAHTERRSTSQLGSATELEPQGRGRRWRGTLKTKESSSSLERERSELKVGYAADTCTLSYGR